MGASMNRAYFNSFAAGAKNVDAAVTPRTSGSYRPGSSDAPSVPASVLFQVRAAGGVISAAGRLVGQAPAKMTATATRSQPIRAASGCSCWRSRSGR